MARQLSGKKPKDLGYTVRTLLSYMGRHRLLLLAVAVLVSVSALANLLGTYMIRPIVNRLVSGDLQDLAAGVAVTAAIYLVGALCAFGYTQTMVKAAQKVLFDIRRDLFAHLQTLPLRFFDTRRHGDIMSYFTNDVDTISDALNNSFAMLIQSFIQVAGTLTMLYLLNWRLSLVVTVCYVVMFWYIKYSGKRSKAYYSTQQACLGDLDGYIDGVLEGKPIIDSDDLIPKRERSGEYLMLRLRTTRGIEEWEYRREYFMNFDPIEAKLAEYEHNGWAARVGQRWRLTPVGFLLSNQLIGELLELQESATLETTLPKVRQTPPPPPSGGPEPGGEEL